MNNVDMIRHLEEIVSPVHLVKSTGEFLYSSTESRSGNDLLFDDDKRYNLMCALFKRNGPMLLHRGCRYGGIMFPGGEYLLIGPVAWIRAGDDLPDGPVHLTAEERALRGAPVRNAGPLSSRRAFDADEFTEVRVGDTVSRGGSVSLLELARGVPMQFKAKDARSSSVSRRQESRGSAAKSAESVAETTSDPLIDMKIAAVNAMLKTYMEVTLSVSDDNIPINSDELKNFLKNGIISSKKLALNEVFMTNAPHNSYAYELKHLQGVTDGDPDGALSALRSPMHGEEGHMGFTPLRHAKNSAIVNATLDARAAIRGGVRVETAYTTADYIILLSELCQTVDEAVRLREECTYTFADLVRQAKSRSRQKYSAMVQKILEEIERSIFVRVTREQLVKCVGRNEDYVQRVFKNEVGNSIMEHLRRERIRVAKEMMDGSSDIKISEIAATLQFSSTSHFARVFKQYANMAPAEYREKIYRDRLDGVHRSDLPAG